MHVGHYYKTNYCLTYGLKKCGIEPYSHSWPELSVA